MMAAMTEPVEQAAEPQPGTTPLPGRFAAREITLIAVAFTVVLLAVGGRYGYHRDELYFIAVGGHPAFGYVDQPPLAPLLAHLVDVLSGHSLFWLRVPPAVAGGAVVVLTGRIAAEFGARLAAQCLAAGCMAVSAILLDASHLATTTGYDLLGWTLISWLTVRAFAGHERCWLWVGLVSGVALEIKTLPVFLLFALAVGVALVGPRTVFASRHLWAGSAIALALWTPNLVWQATHGWPQLQLSADIANGSSGTSQPRWVFLPFQGLLVSPVLVPVWVAGLRCLATGEQLRRWRAFAVAFGVLVVVLVAVGGKPYYLSGTYPVLLAAGAEPTVRWAVTRRWRRALVGAAVALSAVIDATLMLPLVPAADLHSTPIVAVNYDAGEQVGWPRFAATVGGVVDALPRDERRHAIVIGENYGEAGAMARYRPDLATYGSQNSYWDLGTPPTSTTVAVVVGYDRDRLRRWFGSVTAAATIDDGVRLDNDEQGTTVYVCRVPLLAWPTLWRAARHLG
jgi:hypothetical protein